MTPLRSAMAVLVLGAAALATPALAGPPYVTDDPEIPDTGTIESFAFVEGTHGHDGTAGSAGAEFNLGAAKDLQLSLGIPIEYVRGAQKTAGLGDIELDLKYRFLRQNDGRGLDVAVHPSIELPTGTHGFGSDKAVITLPIAAEKDIGPWSIFGTVGYTLNPGAVNRNFWSAGAAVQRQVSKRLALGAEAFFEGADEVGGFATTGVGVAAQYDLAEHLSLVGAIGPLLSHTRETGDFRFYFGLRVVR